jgi:sulfate adenylyltransferase subunit 1 (EFTu-like GTPase family)
VDGGRGDAARPAYWLKLGTQTVTANIQAPKYQVNVNTMEHLAAKTLELNAIGVANLSVDRQLVFEPYEANRDLGGFILIDKLTNATVAAGMLHFSAAPRAERPLAGDRRDARAPCARAQAAEAGGVVVHRAVGRRANRPSPIWSSASSRG